MKTLLDGLAASALDWAFGLPWWVWAVPVGVLAGLSWNIYRLMGWRGLLAALAFVVTVGAYRQGWNNARDHFQRRQFEQAAVPSPKRQKPSAPKGREVKRPTVWDIFNGRRN